MRRFLILAMAGSLEAAEPKKTRDEMVHEDRAALAENDAWIYNDLESAVAEAEKTKKPLMVIHRCIP